jgi:hypothetical protein
MTTKPLMTGMASAVLLLVSLSVHLLIFKGVNDIPGFVDMSLTAGMVIAWLLTSKFLKELHRAQPDEHPVRLVTQNAPLALLVLTGFFMLYAVINMGMMIRTNWQGSNIRGVSGFWLFFYALAIVVSWARWRQDRMHSQSQNS